MNEMSDKLISDSEIIYKRFLAIYKEYFPHADPTKETEIAVKDIIKMSQYPDEIINIDYTSRGWEQGANPDAIVCAEEIEDIIETYNEEFIHDMYMIFIDSESKTGE